MHGGRAMILMSPAAIRDEDTHVAITHATGTLYVPIQERG